MTYYKPVEHPFDDINLTSAGRYLESHFDADLKALRNLKVQSRTSINNFPKNYHGITHEFPKFEPILTRKTRVTIVIPS